MPDKVTDQEKAAIKDMAPCCHYPDRDHPFDFEKSEVIAFFCTTLDVDLSEAIRAFERARRNKWIVFDPVSKNWMGCKRMEPKESDGD